MEGGGAGVFGEYFLHRKRHVVREMGTLNLLGCFNKGTSRTVLHISQEWAGGRGAPHAEH